MKVLVTGAGGFLGLALVKELVAQGHAVRALVRRRATALESLGVEIVQADLRARAEVVAACRQVQWVFHTAAVAGIAGPWRHFFENNILATSHVLEGCRKHGVERLVFTSSPSVTFDGTDQNGIGESAPYSRRWLCHYPHSKALAEQEVLAANQPGRLLTCALRPHLIWGPGDRHLIPRLLDRARSGRLRRVGDGSNRIDMIYIQNAVTAHLQAGAALVPGSPVGGQAYFISQGEPVNCWQWIDQILALAGLSPVRKSVSFSAAWRIGAVLEAAWAVLRLPGEPPMTRFLAAQLAKSHYFDIGRARRDFGYEPQVPTEQGMRNLAAELAGTP